LTSASATTAWTRSTLETSEGLLQFPEQCIEELKETARILDRNPLHPYLLDPHDYPTEATRAFMTKAKATLDRGCGFVVLDHLSVRELGRERSKDLYWLLSCMIARPVAQAFKGTMLYDVRDFGLAQISEVRGDLTREDLNCHTDYGYNCPARYVGLLVLRVARCGGVSSVASLATLRAEMGRRHRSCYDVCSIRTSRTARWNTRMTSLGRASYRSSRKQTANFAVASTPS
jgi:hypothetical protein